MPDLIKVKYNQTGQSKSTSELGMREMQEKLLKAERHNIY